MVSTFRAKHDIDQTFAHLARCLVIVLLWPVIANAEEAQRPDDDALAKSIVEKADHHGSSESSKLPDRID